MPRDVEFNLYRRNANNALEVAELFVYNVVLNESGLSIATQNVASFNSGENSSDMARYDDGILDGTSLPHEILY